MSSIQTAYNLKYEMSEFDVRLTGDGIAILFHDKTYLDRRISSTTYKELNSIIPVNTLEELFKWFILTENYKLNIEIKSDGILNSGVEKEICRLIKKFKIEHRVLISSFNPLSLYKVRRYCPEVYRALLLTLEKQKSNTFLIKRRLLNFLCRPHVLNLRYIDFLDKGVFLKISKKIPVVLWTVNDITFLKKVKNNIHGVISDQISPREIYDLNMSCKTETKS